MPLYHIPHPKPHIIPQSDATPQRYTWPQISYHIFTAYPGPYKHIPHTVFPFTIPQTAYPPTDRDVLTCESYRTTLNTYHFSFPTNFPHIPYHVPRTPQPIPIPHTPYPVVWFVFFMFSLLHIQTRASTRFRDFFEWSPLRRWFLVREKHVI